MMFVDFNAGNKEYKLRLNTRSLVALEKSLGYNPLSIFGDGDTLPTITDIIKVLHASLTQYNHSITLDGAFDIFDDFIADGHVMTDFLPVILEVYKVSGLIKNDKVDNEKNV